MSFLLLLEQFAHAVHQLFIAEFFQCRLLFRRQFPLHALEQPVERNFRILFKDRFDAFEIAAEGLVEFVEVGFILDQRHARQVIEIVERRRDDVFLHGFEQDQKLLDRDRNAGIFKREKEID